MHDPIELLLEFKSVVLGQFGPAMKSSNSRTWLLILIKISVMDSCSCYNSFEKIFVRDVIDGSFDWCNRSLETWCLEYTIRLLRVAEPMEDRMEQALFSPPLSK